MKTEQLAKLLNAEIINLADKDRLIKAGYAGDFLSFVIGKSPESSAWFTVMNNVNVCAVATLADIATIVLCENILPDENLLDKIKNQGVNLISTKHDIYNAVKICSTEL